MANFKNPNELANRILKEVNPNQIAHEKNKEYRDPAYQKWLADEKSGEHKIAVTDDILERDAKLAGGKYPLLWGDSYRKYLNEQNLDHSVDNLKNFLTEFYARKK